MDGGTKMKASDIAYLIYLISQQGKLPIEIERLKVELQQAHANAQKKGLWRVPVWAEITIEAD